MCIEDRMEARIQGYRILYEEMSGMSKAVAGPKAWEQSCSFDGIPTSPHVRAHETQVTKSDSDQGFCFFLKKK